MENNSNHPAPVINRYQDGTASSLRNPTNYKKLRFYHRSDVLYQLTQMFCKRFFKPWGDRTVDQMVQAARSTKQNIVEGCVDGVTSMASELKLLGVARGSNSELMEDYQDYLKREGLEPWQEGHPRYQAMLDYCRDHYRYADYQMLLPRLNGEELANMALCLCHQVDSALEKYIERKDREFTTEGGVRERMTAARLDQRETQRETIARQQQEIARLQQQIARLQQQVARLQQQIARLQQQD